MLPSIPLCRNQEWWHETFYEELIREDAREAITQDHLAFALPLAADRAHDHGKRLCVYWKMPKCEFRLPLTDFEQLFLKTMWMAPAQLIAVAWCYISSFERLFKKFRDKFGELKSIPLFANYFSLYKSFKDFILVKRKADSVTLFDINGNPKVKKVDDWNKGWVYLTQPDRV